MTDYSKITPQMVQNGDVYIEVYPMVFDPECSRMAEKGETPDFYDVWLRPDYWDSNDNMSYAEFDGLSFAEANDKAEELAEMFPGIAISWIEV